MMMARLSNRLLKRLDLLFIVPWLFLSGLGCYWLWQAGYLPEVFLILSAFYGFMWLISRRLKNKSRHAVDFPSVTPDDHWSPEATEIWRRINTLAEQLNPADYPLSDSQRLIELAKQVTGEVASYYSPNKDGAGLDVPLRNILYISEKVSRDLRNLLDDNIPFSHLLTVNNGLQIWKWKARLESGHVIYRLGSLLLSPVASLPRELKHFFIGKAVNYPMGAFEGWLLQTLVKTIGYYAIELYGGQSVPLRAHGITPEPLTPPKISQPIHVLIAGQIKSGKSSLINALSGDLSAATDVLPLTDVLTKYELHDDRLGDMLVFDSPGYDDENAWFEQDPDQALGGFDLIVLVCAANQAARAADLKFMAALRAWFDQHLKRRLPPVIAVVTHIDQLRPLREWNPPYDVLTPQNAKAQSIRDALDSISGTLHIPAEDCIHVSLKPRIDYNIDAVRTALAEKLPESLRAQHLRCLVENKRREKWALIRKQLAHAGSFAVKQIKQR